MGRTHQHRNLLIPSLMRGLCTERMTARSLEVRGQGSHQREVQADRAHVAAQQLVILLEPLHSKATVREP